MNTATFGQLIGEAGRVRLAAIRERRSLSLNECAAMLRADLFGGSCQ